MKAIQTKYIGPADRRGSRMKASDGDGNSVTLSYDHMLNSDENHDAAAVALCRKMGWTDHDLQRGWIGSNCYCVFESEHNRVSIF